MYSKNLKKGVSYKCLLMFVVDTNVLFAALKEESFTRKLLFLLIFRGETLISPSLALEEIEEKRELIKSKFCLNDIQFSISLEIIKSLIEFIPKEEYCEFLKKAEEVSPDPEDIAFFALALKFSCPIWGNDKRLKEPKQCSRPSTKEIA